ncbi:MAG: ATP-binding protein [Chitinophagales bacterium]
MRNKQNSESATSLRHRRSRETAEIRNLKRALEIESALERVRIKVIDMRKSEDLSGAVAIVFAELGKLDIGTIRCGISIINKERKTTNIWSTVKTGRTSSIQVSGDESMDIHPLLQGAYNAWLKIKDFSYHLHGKDMDKFYDAMARTNVKLPAPDKKDPEQREQFLFVAHFPAGGLYAFRNTEFSAEAKEIIRRFAFVFHLAYTRFRDLLQAEAQTSEARVEAALERIRAKAMAMHSSRDLSDTIALAYQELRNLSVTPRRCGVALIDKERRVAELSSMNTLEGGKPVEVIGELGLKDHPLLEEIYNHWLRQEEFHPALRGKELKSYYEFLQSQVAYPDYSYDAIQYGHYFMFKEGHMYLWTEKELSENELKIYRRFASVIGLTYGRYKDLKLAEDQAREATRRASLDRVRAEIASMRTTADLDRITPLIWNQLKILGVPFFRCGVYLINEKDRLVHVYLTTPDAQPLAAFHLGFDSSPITSNTVEHWRQQKVYREHWDREHFVAWVQSLMVHGQVFKAETYQFGENPPESLTLQFVPFSQGMLYVGSAETLPESQIELVQSLAESFSAAYARYEDFRKLEEAKNQIEATLARLRATQNQLIQSEKMASLGELTAGIAHEIQNPLNFVNNFSEVSNELLEEMKLELSKGDHKTAIEIADEVTSNMEKIIHHGKRADSIVKGMLQHSHASSGQFEKTDINTLAEEFLRLAYHGLRAKDKSFNASFKTDLDPGIGEIKLMPQEFGRVLVNLINNAFYAVSQKKNEEIPGFEPRVTVTTRKLDNKVELRVSDNGNGIPSNVLDKIFQPFFTTKPAGQGTGLGLSMAYEIITKGHNGELKVETKEAEGTEFIILLPNPPAAQT